MKIAFFVHQFPVLSQTFILHQITGLLDRGHQVDIYSRVPGEKKKVHPEVMKYGLLDRTMTVSQPPEPYYQRLFQALGLIASLGVKNPKAVWRALLHKPGLRGLLSFRTLFQISTWVQNGPYDIIHCHFGPQGLEGLKLRRLAVTDGVPFVVSFYGFDVTRFPKHNGANVYTELFHDTSKVLALSQSMRERLIGLGCPSDRVSIHHLGISPAQYPYSSRILAASERVKVVSIARLVEKKGIEFLIKSVAELPDKLKSMIDVEIIGDGPLQKELVELAKSVGLSSQVTFHGSLAGPDVVARLSRAHLFVLPSVRASDGDEEGTPTAILEAMAMGIPVLSTWHSGIPELVEDGVSGYLVPERDAEALSSRLADLVQHPERWDAMGSAGREKVEREFDIDKLNDRLVHLYEELLER